MYEGGVIRGLTYDRYPCCDRDHYTGIALSEYRIPNRIEDDDSPRCITPGFTIGRRKLSTHQEEDRASKKTRMQDGRKREQQEEKARYGKISSLFIFIFKAHLHPTPAPHLHPTPRTPTNQTSNTPSLKPHTPNPTQPNTIQKRETGTY